MCMCKFTLGNGLVLDEIDYADINGEGGWRNFPSKREVISIQLAERHINAETVKLPKQFIRGFAVHWIDAQMPGMECRHIAREVMIVMKNHIVFVATFNIKDAEWSDYMDDLKRPEKPHLFGYINQLHQHGM